MSRKAVSAVGGPAKGLGLPGDNRVLQVRVLCPGGPALRVPGPALGRLRWSGEIRLECRVPAFRHSLERAVQAVPSNADLDARSDGLPTNRAAG
jgi:hypothetical protein